MTRDDNRSFNCFEDAPEWSWTGLAAVSSGNFFVADALLEGAGAGGPSCAARSWARSDVIDPCCLSYLVSALCEIS